MRKILSLISGLALAGIAATGFIFQKNRPVENLPDSDPETISCASPENAVSLAENQETEDRSCLFISCGGFL